ncbi:unnamed protein product, partial [marine sediment metagenome]
MIRLKNTSSGYKKYTFAAVFIFFLLLFILFCYPTFNTSHISYAQIGNEVLEIKLDCPKIPKISDYFIINIKAKNNNSIDFPVGSVLIRWKYTGSDKFESTDQQRFKIFIDGCSHNYYIPVGENRYWINKFPDG